VRPASPAGKKGKKGDAGKARPASPKSPKGRPKSGKKGKKEPPPPPPPAEDPERDLWYGHIWRPPSREFVNTHDTGLSHVQALFGAETCRACLDDSPGHADQLYNLLLLLRPFSFDRAHWLERAPLPPLIPQADPSWERKEDGQGRVYYLQTLTQETSWTQPMLPVYPPGWSKLNDPETGRNYYVHPEARVSQWEPPPRPPLPQTALESEQGEGNGAGASNGVGEARQEMAGGSSVAQEDGARPQTAGVPSIERLPSSSRPKTSGLA